MAALLPGEEGGHVPNLLAVLGGHGAESVSLGLCSQGFPSAQLDVLGLLGWVFYTKGDVV